MNGFIINKLIYTGSGVQEVTVDFKMGVNAIIGSSDTGKSFIFKCIDFMFAKEKPPTIKEAEGYDTLYMVINIGSDTLITLKRTLSIRSKLLVYRCPYEEISGKTPEEYSCSVAAKKSMNKFYYSLLGVTEPSYVNESKDKTKQFTVRYFIKYFMLNENSIIEDSFSPVLVRRQNHMRVFDKNAFDFLISNYNETEKRTQKQGESVRKIENQLELIDTMIGEHSDRLKEKESKLDSASTDNVYSVIESLREEIIIVQSRIKTSTNEKIKLKRNINRNKNRVENLDETQQRFVILNQQYQNEIERYEFIYQGSHLLDQLPKRKCPVCDNEFSIEEIDSDAMYEAMNVEKGIIKKKQLDLQESINDVVDEIDALTEEVRIELEELKVVDNEILTLTQNELSDLDQRLAGYIQHEQLVSDVESLKGDIERLKTRRTTLESKTDNKDEIEKTPIVNREDLISNGIELLCDNIASKLEKWLYHEKVSVEFDDDFDLAINGKARRTFGKGYKSLIHTAYYLAMFDVMKTVGIQSFNFMIIDSPLTAYTGSEVRENGDVIISEDTINDFYVDLQNEYKDCQIIIIDNEKLPLNNDVHEIHFTGSKSIGRYGLFPIL